MTPSPLWRGEGILRIAPIGAPWSVWLFWERGWQFAGWYINLETPIRREGRHVYAVDHVLDIWVTLTTRVTRRTRTSWQRRLRKVSSAPRTQPRSLAMLTQPKRPSHRGSPRSPTAGRTGGRIRGGWCHPSRKARRGSSTSRPTTIDSRQEPPRRPHITVARARHDRGGPARACPAARPAGVRRAEARWPRSLPRPWATPDGP